MKEIISLIMQNAYESPEQLAEAEEGFKLLINGNSISEIMELFMKNSTEQSFLLIEKGILKMEQENINPKLIGDKLHNLCGLIDLAFECSVELAPNPFVSLGDALIPLGKKYPRSHKLEAFIKDDKK
ncbi:MAG: hypothetical protein K8R54_09770 [Bacteroidales bacterium]|nr:hypothetical protein [Bacteroidales bacterium]